MNDCIFHFTGVFCSSSVIFPDLSPMKSRKEMVDHLIILDNLRNDFGYRYDRVVNLMDGACKCYLFVETFIDGLNLTHY